MYVVIVCANCDAPSQVEEIALGKTVQCPLCGKPTVARTREAVLPVAKPLEEPAAPALLSLDDAPPLPSRVSLADDYEPTKSSVSPKAKRSPVRTAVYASVSLFLTLMLMGLIWKAFHYGSGEIPADDWKKFKPPDGRCEISLPGDPETEDIAAEGFGVLGGKRFAVNRWFERVRISFGWIDLDGDKVLGVKFDQIALPFRDRELKRLNGKLIAEGTVNFNVGTRKFEARVYQIDTDQGKAFLQIYFEADPASLPKEFKIEKVREQIIAFVPSCWYPVALWVPVEVMVEQRRRVFGQGARLRLYFARAVGKKITADTAWVTKFFNSFVPD